MEEAEWNPSDATRARQKGTESNSFSSLSPRDTTRCLGELWGPGEPGGSPESSPCSGLGAIDTSLLRGDEGVVRGAAYDLLALEV